MLKAHTYDVAVKRKAYCQMSLSLIFLFLVANRRILKFRKSFDWPQPDVATGPHNSTNAHQNVAQNGFNLYSKYKLVCLRLSINLKHGESCKKKEYRDTEKQRTST